MAGEEPRAADDISDALFNEAARWLTRIREPDASPRTRRKFERWLSRDGRHGRAYDQANRLWGALHQPASKAAVEHEGTIAAPAPRSKRLARNVARGVLAALCLLTWTWWYRGGLDDLRADYVTVAGGRQRQTLKDGTVIDLNTDTAVAVDMDHGRRSVHIFRGEVYLTVSHDANRPFTATTPNGRILDIGAAFNVRVRESETVVSLIEGEVNVSVTTDPSAKADLRPREEIAMGQTGLGAAATFDVSHTIAWRTGRMVFFQTPLGDVVDELNRYQRGRILILGRRLRELPVTGVFSTDDPTEAIHVIEATLGLSEFSLMNALTVLH